MSPGIFRSTDGRPRRLETVFLVTGAALSMSTFAVSFYTAKVNVDDLTASLGLPQFKEAERLAAANADISAKVVQLQRQVSSLTPSQAERPPTSQEVAKLTIAVKDLSDRQKRIEDAISRDPAKALELPLIRRDIESLKATQTQADDAIKQSITQIYDMNKWLIGGAALSLLSIAASLLLARWKGTDIDPSSS